MNFFLREAWAIGKVVLLIAILTAALNYALTGTGLKENIVKILKATVFCFIVLFGYPQIIGFITSWTYSMAARSIYPLVASHFEDVTEEIHINYDRPVYTGEGGWRSFGAELNRTLLLEDRSAQRGMFSKITQEHRGPQFTYTTVAPAAVIGVIFVIAGECVKFADEKKRFELMPEFARVLKGLGCAFLIMFAGVFALIEYLVCFLEFALVASVGIILFPLSLWDGSKFMSEKFIGAIVGFFIKLLFCNVAIFLLLYGLVSLCHIISTTEGFTGGVDQILFIVFSSLLFFFICKSAPGVAQSLLSGIPTLNAAGAITAVSGAIAGAAAVGGLTAKAGRKLGGGTAKAVFGGAGALTQAFSAGASVGESGGNPVGGFMKSLAGQAGETLKGGAYGLTRSLLGGGNNGGNMGMNPSNPYSQGDQFKNGGMKFGEYFAARAAEGAKAGPQFVDNYWNNHILPKPEKKG